MRTIRLREHQTSTEELTQDELSQLLSLGHLGVTPTKDGPFDLRPGSTVGTVVLPDLHVLIRPKIPLPNLFFLLAYGAGLTSWERQQFPHDTDDLLAGVAWAFEAMVRRAARFGLVRDYRREEAMLTTVRGRIHTTAQLRHRPGRAYPLACTFDEFDEDTGLNRIVKAATVALLRLPSVDPDLRQALRHHLQLFAAVEDVEPRRASAMEPVLDRRSEPWHDVAGLAQLICRGLALRDDVGNVQAPSFTVNMNILFERFVERVVCEEIVRAGLSLDAQARRRLTDRVAIRPDLVVQRHGRDVAVGDIKYKHLDIADWPHADLYQLLAYCVALGLPSGLLIYGEAEESRHEVVRRLGTILEIRSINLAAPPQEVLEATRDLAQQLLRQAGRRELLAV